MVYGRSPAARPHKLTLPRVYLRIVDRISLDVGSRLCLSLLSLLVEFQLLGLTIDWKMKASVSSTYA